ncbi:MAG: TAXI family TRAP transporter solute-binding subunit [Acetobacterales bacterium]
MQTKTVTMLLAGALACGLAAVPVAGNAQDKPSRITMLSGSPGGSWYPISAGIAEALGGAGIDTRVEQGGGGSNILNISAGRAEAGFGLTTLNYVAKQGGGVFKKPVEGVMGLTVLFKQIAHTVVTKESGVTSYDQLKGKRMASQPVSNGSTAIFRDTLTAYGLNGEEDLNIVVRGSPSAGANAVKDRQAIGFILTTSPPTSAVLEVAQALDIRLLPISDNAFANLSKANPGYSRGVIPGGTYEGIPEDVVSVGDDTILMTHPGVSEDTAYWIVRGFAEQLPQIHKVHPALSKLSVKDMAGVQVLDLHPGAVKYYKEAGAM